MPNQNRKQPKRIRNLIAICTVIAVVLSVSTYAWFIGMRTVNVSSFDVQIATTDSLSLSLNGQDWSPTINISQDTFRTGSYGGNTNNWGGRGLLPMSSIGDMDTTASRMKLFEKASLTATPGGYRIMASRVPNYDNLDPERDGYVVFDLFVHNYSGTQYLSNLEPLDEEAIYLTNDSSVTVSSTGGVADTGIENSVRVAFTQIGRVTGTTTLPATITGISCTSDANVTGICRTAQIWEPNDTNHTANAISWYDTSCLHRTGGDVTKDTSYAGGCKQIVDGLAYPTYAVRKDIGSAANVDIYDGTAYNGYTTTVDNGTTYDKYGIIADSTTELYSYPYFTDTMKLLTGTNRPTFITLEPNSITKIRVYIYIEGQDVDNYDFASVGKAISVKFGFTKERFTEDDIQYNPNGGPDLNQGDGPLAADKTAPVITLTGSSTINLTVGDPYVEEHATATDNVDGDVTEHISETGTVNTEVAGTYRVLYSVTDAAGNTGTKVRYIVVSPVA